MGFLRAPRWIVIAVAGVFAVAVGVGAWWYALPSASDGVVMGDYGPETQRDWARRLVVGLNTREAEQVPVWRPSGESPGEQRRAIDHAMPAADCRYDLLSVEDRGAQSAQDVPGLTGPRNTHRFDMTVEHVCPGRPSQHRDIGVIAIADMGYWNPYLLVVD
jgi:hypothetical protein